MGAQILILHTCDPIITLNAHVLALTTSQVQVTKIYSDITTRVISQYIISLFLNNARLFAHFALQTSRDDKGICSTQ